MNEEERGQGVKGNTLWAYPALLFCRVANGTGFFLIHLCN